MSIADQGFALFQARQRQLLGLLQKSQPVLARLNMKAQEQTLRQLIDRVATDSLKVIILGEFKRGKSTFINALLGREILPAFATPCTAVINEISWGDSPKAVLHFRNPLPAPLPATLPPEVQQHVEKAQGKAAPPLEIPINDLEKYVVIADPARDQAQSVAETPYERVVLHWPLELCKHGVLVIDSPGLNEHNTRTRVTTDYLTRVDGVVFVLSCQALASQSEIDAIENNVRAAGYDDIFFVCNRFDEIRERDRDRVIRYGRDKLGGRTRFGPEGVFFLSALDALEGRERREEELVQRSGIVPFEKQLARFLIDERGKIKLLQPARLLMKFLREDGLNKIIPGQRGMLLRKNEELEKKYRDLLPHLKNAERKRDQILEKVRMHRERLRDEVRRETQTRLRELETLLPDWVREIKPTTTFTAVNVSQQLRRLAEEVGQALAARLEREQAAWQSNRLQPLIQQRLTEMAQDIAAPVDHLLEDLETAKLDLTGSTRSAADDYQVGGLERVLAAAGGMIVLGPGAAFVGANLGFTEMLKSLVPQFALVAGILLLGVTNPVTFVPALIAAGVVQALLKAGNTAEKVKTRVADGLVASLREKATNLSQNIADAVHTQTEKIAAAVKVGMDKEIQSVQEQVEGVVQIKRAGEVHVQKQLKALATAEEQLKQLDAEMTSFLFAVANPS